MSYYHIMDEHFAPSLLLLIARDYFLSSRNRVYDHLISEADEVS